MRDPDRHSDLGKRPDEAREHNLSRVYLLIWNPFENGCFPVMGLSLSHKTDEAAKPVAAAGIRKESIENLPPGFPKRRIFKEPRSEHVLAAQRNGIAIIIVAFFDFISVATLRGNFCVIVTLGKLIPSRSRGASIDL